MAQLVKSLPAMWEIRVQSLGWEDSPGEEDPKAIWCDQKEIICMCVCIYIHTYTYIEIFPCSSVSKESACNAGDLGSIPESGRSPAEGNGNPRQYSYLENPHGQRSLVGYSPWGHKELDRTEILIELSSTNISNSLLHCSSV